MEKELIMVGYALTDAKMGEKIPFSIRCKLTKKQFIELMKTEQIKLIVDERE